MVATTMAMQMAETMELMKEAVIAVTPVEEEAAMAVTLAEEEAEMVVAPVEERQLISEI